MKNSYYQKKKKTPKTNKQTETKRNDVILLQLKTK